jgi:hypothetical protein
MTAEFHVEDWMAMKSFALRLIIESDIHHQDEDVMSQRIKILHLDHANELLMKSWLTREGYVINILTESVLKKGIRSDDLLYTTAKSNRTLGYESCLELVSKKIEFPKNKKEVIKSFHSLRNEIQHRSLDLPLDKVERIENFYPILKEFYDKMFQDGNFPD